MGLLHLYGFVARRTNVVLTFIGLVWANRYVVLLVGLKLLDGIACFVLVLYLN